MSRTKTFAVCLAAFLPAVTWAGEYTWTGGGSDDNWTSPANWGAGDYPRTSADSAYFTASAPRQPTVDNNVSVASICATGNVAWTWSGSAIVGLYQAFAYGSSGSSTWNPVLTGTGALSVTAGQLTINSTNNYSGGTTVSPNKTLIGKVNGNPFGFGPITVHAGTLAAQSIGSATVVGGSGGVYNDLNYEGVSVVKATRGGGGIATTLSLGSVDRVGGARGILVVQSPNGSQTFPNRGVFSSDEMVTSTNPPTITNGMLPPCFLGRASSSLSGQMDFLTYGANGFVTATYDVNTSTSSDLQNALATDKVLMKGNQTLTSDKTVYALVIGYGNISGSYTLTLTSGGLFIFDDRTIACNLQFNSVEGIIAHCGMGFTISGNICGTGGVTVMPGLDGSPGTDKFTISGDNTGITGAWHVVGSSAIYVPGGQTWSKAFGSTANQIVLNGGGIDSVGGGTISHNFTVGAAGGTLKFQAGATLSGTIDGTGVLTFENYGGSTYAVASTNPNWSGGSYVGASCPVQVNASANLGTGNVRVAGTLNALGNSNIAVAARLAIDSGGTVNFKSAAPIIGLVQGAGSIVLGNTGVDSTLTVSNNAPAVYGGAIGQYSGRVGSLTKTGSGILTLSGSNTYSGLTSVNAGGLILDGSVAGNVSVADSVSLSGKGAVNGNLTMNNGAIFSVTINATNDHTQLAVTGTVTLATNSVLSSTLGFKPAGGEMVYLVVNPGLSAVSGTFRDTREGSRVTIGMHDGRLYSGRISYVADADGTPNDIAIVDISELAGGTLITVR